MGWKTFNNSIETDQRHITKGQPAHEQVRLETQNDGISGPHRLATSLMASFFTRGAMMPARLDINLRTKLTMPHNNSRCDRDRSNEMLLAPSATTLKVPPPNKSHTSPQLDTPPAQQSHIYRKTYF